MKGAVVYKHFTDLQTRNKLIQIGIREMLQQPCYDFREVKHSLPPSL